MIINVCFHGIGICAKEREEGESRYWVPRQAFWEILDEAVGRPNVRLSFDDGNRSDIDLALPALRDRGLRATFFALAGRLDDPASLSPADLKDLRAAGMGIGNHGWRHVPWRGLSDEDAWRELHEARDALAEVSEGSVDEAALPLGRYDRGLLKRLKSADYQTIYTSDRFPARPTSWFQARYSVTASDTAESLRHVFSRSVSFRDARNLAASAVKRIR